MTMARCPFAAPKTRGAHSLSAVIPDTVEHPLLLFCDRCGATVRHAMTLPLPLDDLPADAIARLARRRA